MIELIQLTHHNALIFLYQLNSMVRHKVLSFFGFFLLFVSAIVLIQFMLYEDASVTGNVVNSSDILVGSLKPMFAFAAVFVFLVILVNFERRRFKVSGRAPIRVK